MDCGWVRACHCEGADGPYPLYLVSQESYDTLFVDYEQRFGHPPQTNEPGEWVTAVNPEFFQIFNALFVIVFTPLVVGFFAWMATRANVTTGRKIFFGLCLTCGSLLLMALAGTFSDGGAINIMDGRYGPYVKWEKVNATLPKDVEPADVTMEMAVALIAEKSAKSGTKKKAAAKKKAPAKKTAAKKSTTKKASAKKAET